MNAILMKNLWLRKYINQKKYMKDIDIDMKLILLTKTNLKARG